jgi:hypothetical protein
LTTQHHINARIGATDLFGDVAQTHFLGAKSPRQRSLFDIQMGGQWNSSGWILHQ